MLGAYMRKQQSGVMLLEALIAILIFSLGVLGIVGLQATAVSVTSDAKYRTDAGLLVNELIGEMWSGDRLGATLQGNFQGSAGFVSALPKTDPTRCSDHPSSDGLAYCLWFNNRVLGTLPGVGNFPPEVVITPGVAGPPTTASVVTINLYWVPPNISCTLKICAHKYSVVAEII
jgi:type IV pilus assembly protein PilV